MTESIAALKERYAGEWLAIRVTAYEDFQPSEGELVFHHTDSSEVLARAPRSTTERIYFTYAGPLIPDGYAVELCGVSATPA